MDNLCERCYHNYVCEQYNENRDFKRTKCDYKNSHFVDAADVSTVRHGYWRPILHKDGKTDYECSCCLGIIMDVPDDDEHDLISWCSMCGARMDGGEPDA